MKPEERLRLASILRAVPAEKLVTMLDHYTIEATEHVDGVLDLEVTCMRASGAHRRPGNWQLVTFDPLADGQHGKPVSLTEVLLLIFKHESECHA